MVYRRPYKLVFTNGCFDILHAGHLHLLKTARSFGDRLIVGINSDASVSALKGPTRPIQSQDARRLQLSMLPWVDQVEIFDEPTPLNLIRQFEPDVIVKGGDYQSHEVVGCDLACVEIVPLLPGFSTTSLVNKMIG
jgi:D-beta-D-heptose 7-phosphate kinase/D-beta-D-heptose 1-phosphate adenosyltransferase